nr:MAG TPA: hypothetical protein [Caudoviricetes sp.]
MNCFHFCSFRGIIFLNNFVMRLTLLGAFLLPLVF